MKKLTISSVSRTKGGMKIKSAINAGPLIATTELIPGKMGDLIGVWELNMIPGKMGDLMG